MYLYTVHAPHMSNGLRVDDCELEPVPILLGNYTPIQQCHTLPIELLQCTCISIYMYTWIFQILCNPQNALCNLGTPQYEKHSRDCADLNGIQCTHTCIPFYIFNVCVCVCAVLCVCVCVCLLCCVCVCTHLDANFIIHMHMYYCEQVLAV